jgi:outer membrane protein insertion porin family
VTQNNLFGSGDSVSLSGQRSTYSTLYSINYYNPYLTDNGIGIGYNASLSKTNYGDISEFADYSTSAKSFSSYLGIPITETDGVRLGLGVSSNKVNTIPGFTPQVLIDYQNEIGHDTVHTWTGTVGWTHDTRNGYWAPTRGGKLSVSADVALPGSTVQYWKVTAEANHYWPIGKGFVLFLDGQVGDGQTYGKNGIDDAAYRQLQDLVTDHTLVDMREQFPFFQNFFSGGVQDVRGTDEWWALPRWQSRRTYRRRVQGARQSRTVFAIAVPEGRQHGTRVMVRRYRQRLPERPELQCQHPARLDRSVAALAGTDRPADHQLRLAVPHPARRRLL